MLLVPLRMFLIPRMPLTSEELMILDGPTASSFVSDFHLNSVGAVTVIGTAAFSVSFFGTFLCLGFWRFLFICA